MYASDDYDLNLKCVMCGEQQNAKSNLTGQVFKVNAVNNCGHKFCSKCVDRELSKKRQFACPICRTMVARDKLTEKTLEESQVERDFGIRRKVTAIFNKTERDFPNLIDFNNYKETVEDMIYNLVHEIDTAATNEKIERYRMENSNAISLNQFKRREEIRDELSKIKATEESKTRKDQEYLMSARIEAEEKRSKKRQLNQIMLGESAQAAQLDLADGDGGGGGGNKGGVLALAPQPSAPNPVLMFFAQRPLPKPISDPNDPKRQAQLQQELSTREGRRRLHRAGGYDYAIYNRKNWHEIRMQLKEIVPSYHLAVTKPPVPND